MKSSIGELTASEDWRDGGEIDTEKTNSNKFRGKLKKDLENVEKSVNFEVFDCDADGVGRKSEGREIDTKKSKIQINFKKIEKRFGECKKKC